MQHPKRKVKDNDFVKFQNKKVFQQTFFKFHKNCHRRSYSMEPYLLEAKN